MKKSLILVSMVSALLLASCTNNNKNSNPSAGKSSDESSKPVAGQIKLIAPEDLSSMTSNCKKYIDDMRAQHERLVAEKGDDADYYLNDLYGEQGVDLTKGVSASTGYLENGAQNEYLDDKSVEQSDYSKGVELKFEIPAGMEDKEFKAIVSVNEDLSDAKEFKAKNDVAVAKNLFQNQKYYYKIVGEDVESEVAEFTTGDYPRWIDARPLYNVRDQGGYMTSYGKRIKQGLIYRGGEVATREWGNGNPDKHIITYTEESKRAFREDMDMVNGLEMDFRSSSESQDGYISAKKCAFAEDGDIGYYCNNTTQSYVNCIKTKAENHMKDIFEAFAEADEHHVYYHCYGGADRTGTIAFLLGSILGMSYTDLVIDFELTSYSSNVSRNYRSHLRSGPYNDWPNLITNLKSTYGWSEDKTLNECAENYLVNTCGVGADTINKIREIMLED